MFFRRMSVFVAFLAVGLVATTLPAAAKDPVSTGTFNNLAVSGYDPVAYFTAGKPVRSAKLAYALCRSPR